MVNKQEFFCLFKLNPTLNKQKKLKTVFKVTQGNSVNTNYLVVDIKFLLSFGHIMIDLDKIFLNMLKIFLIEFKFILLYCINRITPGHLKFEKIDFF